MTLTLAVLQVRRSRILTRTSAGSLRRSALLVSVALAMNAGPVAAHDLRPMPARDSGASSWSETVLYDQFDNPRTDGPRDVTSQDFEPTSDELDSQAADDFVVPVGQYWSIKGVDVDGEYLGPGPAQSVNVFFYANGTGNYPDRPVASRVGSAFAPGAAAGDFSITFGQPVGLSAGRYCVSVQARQDSYPYGQWFWHFRTVQSNAGAVWQNSGQGFIDRCSTWTRLPECQAAWGSDMVFRLTGSFTEASTCHGLVASTLSVGYRPNHFGYIADNAVAYTYASGTSAPRDFAIFQTHDPWNDTVIKDAITAAGYAYSVFSPADLHDFPFTLYRVVILNWDDTAIEDFATPYLAARASLEGYVRAGGVLWLQAAIQRTNLETFNVPFGGTEKYGPAVSAWQFDPSSPIVTGAPNPILGASASQAIFYALPTGRHVIARRADQSGAPVLYELCAPEVTSIAPIAGPAAGGRMVTIRGRNFNSVSAILFAGVGAPSWTRNSPTKITVTTPAHTVGVTNVRVVSNIGMSPIVADDRYAFQDPPVITSVSPNTGPTTGGQTITIRGSGLLGTTSIKFASTNAASFTINSGTSITAVTPAHAYGWTYVRLTTASGTSPGVAASKYLFVEQSRSPGVAAP